MKEDSSLGNSLPSSWTRRNFLKLAVASALTLVTGHTFTVEAASEPYAILVDTTKCIGCNACTYACKKQNGLPLGEAKYSVPRELSPITWTVVKEKEGSRFKFQCMHCLIPTCVVVCPAGALRKHPLGPVYWDKDRCIGCKSCVTNCPFGIPKWNEEYRVLSKCFMCTMSFAGSVDEVKGSRIMRGQGTACVVACPTGALSIGRRNEIVERARERAAKVGGYTYGIDEAGGTSFIYVTEEPPEKLGLPQLPKIPYTENLLRTLGTVFAVGGLISGGVLLGLRRLLEGGK